MRSTLFSEKLNRKENEVMRAVFDLSGGKERFLVTSYELIAALPTKGGYDEETLERLLRALELDGYFDFILSERKGEKTYVIHMREAGLAYRRSDIQRKRGLMFKFGVAVVSALVTFFVGLLLKLIVK